MSETTADRPVRVRAADLTVEHLGRALHGHGHAGAEVRQITHTRNYLEPVDPKPLVVLTLARAGDVALSPDAEVTLR